jgi:pimeloyl-ACP methyl ester carboxylesterase
MFLNALVLGGVLATSALAPAASPSPQLLSQGLQPGPFAVGIKVDCIFDTSRSFPDSESVPGFSARPIKLLVWYPSRVGQRQPMSFSDYLGMGCADPRFAAYDKMMAARDLDTARRQFNPPSDDLLKALGGARTHASRDTPIAEGRFPLVVHSLGQNDYQLESTVLWEYLASQGFVVAVVPQMGGDPSQRLTFAPASLEIQVADLAFAVGHLSALPYVDPAHLGLIGHSFGGAASLILASRNPNVDAVASLEGAEAAPDGPATLAAVDWGPWKVRAPVLELYAVGPEKDFDAIKSLSSSQVYRVGLGTGLNPTRATHFDFQNWPIYSTLLALDDPRGAAFRPRDLGSDFYLWAVKIVYAFLDGTLRSHADSLRVVTGREPLREVPEGLIRYR